MTAPLIAFLDTLGRDPLAAENLHARVAALDVDAPTREALIGRDAGALARAFGTSPPLWCMVFSPEDEPKPQDDAPGDDPGDPPDRQPDERPGRDPVP